MIFVDNDVIIKSAEGTERKPGIIVIYLITCKKWLGADKYNFEDCRAAIACGLLDDKTERYWTDVIQCWELTSSSGEETSVADELMISEGYMQSTFYAIEQSHISWKVSHVTGIHLRGEASLLMRSNLSHPFQIPLWSFFGMTREAVSALRRSISYINYHS